MKSGLERPTEKVECEKTNHLVEKYSEIGVFAMKNVIAPSFVLPKAIYSFFVYFTSDLGNDALNLPLPAWYVFLFQIIIQRCISHQSNIIYTVDNEADFEKNFNYFYVQTYCK